MKYTQKALILLIGVILLLGAFQLCVYQPKSAQLARLRVEERELDKKIVDLQGKKAGLPRVEKEIEITKRQLKRLEEQYPKTIESVYQAINDAAQEAGFTILKTEMMEEPDKGAKKKSAVREYDFLIGARSTYQALGEFLYGIAHSPVVISVSGLKIVRNDMVVSEFSKVPDLEVKLRLTTYLTKEENR